MVNPEFPTTRLGVLDIGSNTVHMIIVDAAPGARPDPGASVKTTVRLMQYLEEDGTINKDGVQALLAAVDAGMKLAEESKVSQILAMATSAMREAPDVILLGEMRDTETISTAVTAAEMAQLIFSTLHTTGAAGTVDRIIDAFPPTQQRQIRMQLSMVLQAIVSQQLVPTVDGSVTPAWEIMVGTPAIRNLIREEKTYQIDSVIASNGAVGMQTMDQALFNAVREGKVAKDVALQYSHHQEALLRRFQAEGL